MEKISRSHPEQSKATEGEYLHKLKLSVEGHLVGEAEFFYKSEPFPFYYIHFVLVKTEHRGKGYGTKIIEGVNTFLDERGKTGILYDVIEPDNPATGLYGRHRWSSILGTKNWYIHNPPKNCTDAMLVRAIVAADKTQGKLHEAQEKHAEVRFERRGVEKQKETESR